MPHSLKREGDGKTSRQLLEWRIGVDFGIALFRLEAGWGAWGMPCLSELVEKHMLAEALLSEFLWSLGMSARPVSSLH